MLLAPPARPRSRTKWIATTLGAVVLAGLAGWLASRAFGARNPTTPETQPRTVASSLASTSHQRRVPVILQPRLRRMVPSGNRASTAASVEGPERRFSLSPGSRPATCQKSGPPARPSAKSGAGAASAAGVAGVVSAAVPVTPTARVNAAVSARRAAARIRKTWTV